MAKKTERAPVDTEDDDRRAPDCLYCGKRPIDDTHRPGCPRALAPQADDQPQGSAQQDEHRGLAARILDLRKLVESNRLAAVKEHSQTQQRAAQLEQDVTRLTQRIDAEVESIQKQQRDLTQKLHEAGEQVRQAGALARKMTDQVKELEELRAVASDPHEVVRPVQRGLAQLRADLEALGKTIDVRFEQMPRPRAVPLESRSEDEDAIIKLGTELRKLRERVKALEPAN